MRGRDVGALGALLLLSCLAIGAGGHSQSASAAPATPAFQESLRSPDLAAALSALSIAERRSDTGATTAVNAVAGALALTLEPNLKPSEHARPLAFAASALGGLMDQADVDAVLIPFGVAGRNGRLSEGLTTAVAPRAMVFAPFKAEVGFAAPLDGYGQVVILLSDADSAIVLAGLSEVLVRKGEMVAAGAPLGRMPAASRQSEAVGLTRTAIQAPELYIEVRDKGRQADPLPWLAAHH